MKPLIASLFLLFLRSPLLAQPSVELELVANDLGYIVDIAHGGDERLFILTRHGVIKIIENGVELPEPYLDISGQVTTSGEMGSLGLAFDPEFQSNGRFYVHYNPSGGIWESRISRFTADPPSSNMVDPATEQILLVVPQAGSFHNGGDVDFGPDGTLYLTLGDSFNSAASQDYTHPLGSILRIDVSDGGDTYSIPSDNPFATAGGDTLPEIWAKGLRNPFRFGFDALTGDIWIGDVGSSVWEEVNFWPAGDHSAPNFGWRCFEGFVNASSPTPGCGPAAQYVFPAAVHATSGPWCSVIGGRVYRGTQFPGLYGRYLYTDFCAGVIYSLLPDGSDWVNELMASGIGNGNTCIGENSELELFLGKNNGSLYRIIDPLTVAVKEAQLTDLKVYPNPARDHVVIEGDPLAFESLELYDQAGRWLMNVPAAGRTDRIELNVSHLANGTYLLISRNTNGQRSGRVVNVLH